MDTKIGPGFASRNGTRSGSIDSRLHSQAHWIKDPTDIPTDFPFPGAGEIWQEGMFVPGDGKDWRGRMVHPPRIYTISATCLAIYAHPAFGLPPYRVDLKNLVEIACYRGTLNGELRFHGTYDSSGPLHYGPYQHHFIDPFLRTVRQLWLAVPSEPSIEGIPIPARLSDSRCHAALRVELDEGERVRQLCFQPTRSIETSRWFFHRKQTAAARVLVLTDRRLMVAVEGRTDIQADYGITVRSCPTKAVTKVRVRAESSLARFDFVLDRSLIWKFWIGDEERTSMDALVAALNITPENV